MQQDIFKKTEQDNNTAEKASWSKPEIEVLELDMTNGKPFGGGESGVTTGS